MPAPPPPSAAATGSPPLPPCARVLLVAEDVPSLRTGDLGDATVGRRWSIDQVGDERAATAALTERPLDVVVSGLTDVGASLRVLGRAREVRPGAARVLFTTDECGFPGGGAARVAHQVIVGAWEPATLESVLDRALGGAGLISDDRLRELVGKTVQLPSLPAAVTTLLRLLDDPDVSMPAVVRVLQREPAMCAKALQLVNSAFFGLPRRVSSIDQAVLQLGINSIRSVVLTSEAFAAIGAAPEAVVTSVRRRAILAAQIAREMVGGRADDAMSAAMLRDVGDLLLAARLPKRYAECQRRIRDTACAAAAAERATYGASHAQVGAALLSLWGLPRAVTEAVAFSHTCYPHPSRGLDPTVVVFVAGALADEATRMPGATIVDEAWIDAIGLAQRMPELRRYADVVSMTWPGA